jgi:hypothetical protein
VISAVGITETERLIGATTFSRSHWVRSYEDSPTQQVAVHLAGYVAERLASGYEARDYAVSKVLSVPEEMQYVRPEPDAWSAYLVASRVDDGYELLELAANWAYVFLRRAWPQISDVSDALVERGGLTGRDIESILS